MDIYENFLVALDRAISEAGNANQLALKAGVEANLITRWKNRQRVPSLQSLIPLMPFLDWSPAPTMRRIGQNAPVEIVQGDDLPRIPVILEAGAGNAAELWRTEPSKTISVLPQYYRKDVRAVEVVGDSMEPTIRKGAIVGVIPIEGDLIEGGIYLVHRRHFGLQVKRVRADASGGLVLYSDNPAYAPQPIPQEDDLSALIVGQIIWCWQGI